VPAHALDIVVITNGAPVSPAALAKQVIDTVLADQVSGPATPKLAGMRRFGPLKGTAWCDDDGIVVGFDDVGGHLGISYLCSPPAPLLRDMTEELAADAESTTLERKLDAAIARLACHGSIRAGRRMNAAEMDALLRQMEATPRAATCSHGRPTVLKLDVAALERMFGRR
jgi:hypothetical protein